MAFLINWLAAIGALIIFVLVYNDMVFFNPIGTIFVSLMSVLFLGLSYYMRTVSKKYVPLNHTQTFLGLLIVLIIIAATVYFAVPLVEQFDYAAQYVSIGWLALIDVLIVTECLLTFRNIKHPKLEGKINHG